MKNTNCRYLNLKEVQREKYLIYISKQTMTVYLGNVRNHPILSE